MDGSYGSQTTATIYMHIVALSIAFYDYILTLPAEWRFYKSQRSWRLSPGCILFIAIRYSSILVLVTSNLGFFGDFFTEESCENCFMLPPVLKGEWFCPIQRHRGMAPDAKSWTRTTGRLSCRTLDWVEGRQGI